MNTPSIISPYWPPGHSHQHLPDTLILDVAEHLELFHLKTAEMRDFECNISDVLGEILAYIAMEESADDGLETLARDIRYCHNQANGIVDGEILATAAIELGSKMLEKFKHIDAYGAAGVLPYVFGGWIDSDTPFLVKRILG